MVSTRQSSSVSNGSENVSVTDTSGIRTRHTSQQNHEFVPVCRDYVSNKHFMELPPEILDKIFSYTGYKTVSQMRLVSRQLDKTCSSILNSTFQKLQTQMLQRFHTIKGKMPRRESARRNHPLACESDIIETLHMRLTLLQMSFGKHIERKHCCFFAGEILDEVYRILNYIKITPKLARPYRVTDELFDLSTMAMEYFKEHIEPTLPEIAYFGTDFFEFPGGLQQDSGNNKTWMLDSPPHNSNKAEDEQSPSEEKYHSTPQQPQSTTVILKRLRKVKQGMKKYNSQILLLKRDLRNCKTKMTDQQQQFLEYAARMDDYDKKNEETSRKFSTLLQELNKCKTELQYWRSKSPLTSLCVVCKVNNSLSMEELHTLNHPPNAFMEGSQPSTSTSLDETPLSWGNVKDVPTTVEEVAVPTATTSKARHVGSKRKSASDETPAPVKKQKKPRAVFKIRNKLS